MVLIITLSKDQKLDKHIYSLLGIQTEDPEAIRDSQKSLVSGIFLLSFFPLLLE